MKKFGVLLLAFIVCFGLVAVMSGCWGSDDDDDNGNGVVVDEDPVDTALPQSTPAYAGTNSAAPLDTTVAKQAIELPWLIVDISEEIMDVWDIASLAVVLDTTQTFAGADTGTITIWDYIYESESDTLDTHRVITEWAADGYADSAGTYNDIMAADGTLWMETRDEQMYDGEAVEPAGVGTMTGEYYLDHTDFDSFALSTDTEDGEASGYMTMTEDYDYSVGDTVLWEMGYLADVAMADYSGTMVYAGILGASSTVAYDGSETSWVAVGTICLDDGDEEMVPFDGCYDFEFDLIWAGDSDGEIPSTFPDGGTMEIFSSALDTTTIEASALYDFSDTTLDPYCYLLSVDADGSGSYADSIGDLEAAEVCVD